MGGREVDEAQGYYFLVEIEDKEVDLALQVKSRGIGLRTCSMSWSPLVLHFEMLGLPVFTEGAFDGFIRPTFYSV